MAQMIKDEHGATGVVFIEEGGENSLPEDERRALAVFLDPRRAKEIGEVTADNDDEKVVTQQRQQLRLYHCCDESGTLKVTEVKTGPLLQSDLNSNVSIVRGSLELS
jgi:hypothetical protein